MGATFHSSQFGYKLSLPDDWEQMPPDVVQLVFRRLWNPNVKLRVACDAAFQSKPHVTWFQYPYMAVQVLPYSSLGVYHQINADQFEDMIQALNGAAIKKTMDRELSSTARSLMSNPTFGEARLDRGRRRFQVPLSMYVKGVGTVKAVMVGYFGREAVVQFCFYAKETQWDQQFAAAQPILDSFHFDPDKDYSVVAAIEHPSRMEHSSSQSTWLDAVEKRFAEGVAVLVVGALCFMVTQLRKSKA